MQTSIYYTLKKSRAKINSSFTLFIICFLLFIIKLKLKIELLFMLNNYKMSTIIAKQLIINNIYLPMELIDIIKDYTFRKIKKISKNDGRYNMLLTIPDIEYDYIDDTRCVYLNITAKKDYFLVYKKFEIQIQTLRYGDDDDDNTIYFVDGSIFVIE